MDTRAAQFKRVNRTRKIVVLECNCAPDLNVAELKDLLNKALYSFLRSVDATNTCVLTKIHVMTSGSFQDAE